MPPVNRPIPDTISYPEDLPITQWREELLDVIANNQVVIVAGETGSGKSTQLPKMCLELGRGAGGRIGHTQPRRIAARSIAERIASELDTTVGDLVGYAVRFTDRVQDDTAIKVMTDGILLNELQRDPKLSQYDTIIIDEAHERSLNIDFLLGYLKELLPRRPDLGLIVTSATIDTGRFAEFFDDAPVVEVEGRSHPVEVRYRPLDGGNGEPIDQTTGICEAVRELAIEGEGDVLVFCSGEREIRDAVDALTALGLRHTEILPLFGRLSAEEQHRVFSQHTGRRIVVATNVAETSLTVPGIRYVVDTGFARVSRFSKRTKVQQLPIEAVSQASANQRSGRCGRLGPGIAVRLYSEDDYRSRAEFTDPEILRTNLASVMLRMAAIGLGPMSEFPFIESPDTRTVKDGVATLAELGAITDGEEGTRQWLTDIGRKLARVPVDPRLARMLIAADQIGCLNEMLTIVSALAIQDPRLRPQDKEEQADQRHAQFKDPSSDLMSWVRLWGFISDQRTSLTSNQFRRMCKKEFLHWRRIREWQDLRAQLARAARDLRLRTNQQPAAPAAIHEATLAGMLSHVGKKDPKGYAYRGARGSTFNIRPGSSLFKTAPEWVVAAELIETTRTWATGVAPTDPDTIKRVGDHLVRRSVSEPWWDQARGAAVCRETATLYGLTLSSDDIVLFARHDERGARDMFIRHALVAGDWDTHHEFAAQNALQVDEVLEIEERERRRDLLVTDETLVAWFSERIPGGITSAAAFDAWWKDQRQETPTLLNLDRAVLIDPDARAIDDQAFPQVWSYGTLDLDVSYEFDPGTEHDGVTIDIPTSAIDVIDPAAFDANVPGLRSELVEALIRTLPKQQRKRFAPISDTAKHVAVALDPSDGPLVQALARALTSRGGEVVRPDDFDQSRVPTHLQPRFRVVSDAGAVVAEGDNLEALQRSMRSAARSAVSSASHELEQSGVTTWSFGDLPSEVVVEGASGSLMAYPTIVDDHDSVSVRLVATEQERDATYWTGLRRLVVLGLPSPRKLVKDKARTQGPVLIAGSPYPDEEAWITDVIFCAVQTSMDGYEGSVWSKSEFDELMGFVKDHIDADVGAITGDSISLLQALHELELTVEKLPAGYFDDAVADVGQQVNRFLFDGCLAAVGRDRISDLVRYVRGASDRLFDIAEDPEGDRFHMDRINALEDDLDALGEVMAVTPELVEIDWMIQELRMSYFAQSRGVKGKISEQRVRGALADVLRS